MSITSITTVACPRRRADGSFSIAVRYSLTEGSSAPEIEAVLHDCLRAWAEGAAIATRGEFRGLPCVRRDADDFADIVFDLAATSVLWQSFVAVLVRRLAAVNGIEFGGVRDLLSPPAPG